MSKSRRFPGNFFKSFRDDPILDDSVGLLDFPTPADEDEKVASLAAVFSSPFGGDGEPAPEAAAPASRTARAANPKTRDYVVNSIFAPADLRGEAGDGRHELVFIKEHDGTLVGLQEVNALLSKGWRVVNAFATGNSAFFKALVLLERPS